MYMNGLSEEASFFSAICSEKCGGLCCAPWWGIISYQIVKEGGVSNLNGFRTEIIKGINARAQRIVDGYATRELHPNHLFTRPERYNVIVRDIKVSGKSLLIDVMAMFAFRCRYLSEEKVCMIHPAITGGEDIRPPHCGFMGSLRVKPGEKGYCRIIHAAESPEADSNAINAAIEVEKGASLRHYSEGFPTAEMAADRVIEQLKDYGARHLNQSLPQRKQPVPGRNETCYCGSGKKYKVCHGGNIENKI